MEIQESYNNVEFIQSVVCAGVISKLDELKRVFVEGKSSLPEMMQEYYEASLQTQGALLMAVCR